MGAQYRIRRGRDANGIVRSWLEPLNKEAKEVVKKLDAPKQPRRW